jgi:AraC-like DNA-binding protein
MANPIPTYNLQQLSDRHETVLADVFFTDKKLDALNNKLNKPYRSNYYGLAVCLSGKATLLANLEQYEIIPNTVIAMSPQVIKQWKAVSPDFETMTVFFTQQFLAQHFSNQHYTGQFSFFDLHAKHVSAVSASDSEQLIGILTQIQSLARQPHAYQKQILAGYISVLLFTYLGLYNNLSASQTLHQTRSQQMVQAFKQLVNRHFQKERTVKFYADSLFVSAKHLSELVKQETGKTAGEWIDEMVLLEAKILLARPDLQIAQIADALHFSDASTFGKFFKNLSGTSPLSYRQSL